MKAVFREHHGDFGVARVFGQAELPAVEKFVEAFTSSTRAFRGSAVAASGRRQPPPGRGDLGTGERQQWIVQHSPNMLNKASVNPFVLRERCQSRVAQAEFTSISETPRGVKCFGVVVQSKRQAAFARSRAKAMLLVNLLDAVDRRKLLPGLAGITIELQRTRADHRMSRDGFRRLQISFQR